MAVVIFDPARFKVRYPEFANVPNATLQAYFDEAGMFYLSNTDCSPVSNVQKREMLLWMLTAHLTYLGGALSGTGAAPPVGRLASATEGSVSVTMEGLTLTQANAWYMSSPYGQAYWQATFNRRGFQYVKSARGCNGVGRFGLLANGDKIWPR